MYLVSTVLAVTTGLLIVNTLQPGKHFSEEKRIEFKEKYASKMDFLTPDKDFVLETIYEKKTNYSTTWLVRIKSKK